MNQTKTYVLFQIRGILNKLTPEKFEKLCTDIFNVGLDSTTILKGVILLVSTIYEYSVFLNYIKDSIDLAETLLIYIQLCFRYSKKLSMNLNTRLCTHSCANGLMKKHPILMPKFQKKQAHLEDFCSTSAEMSLKTGNNSNSYYFGSTP